MLAHLSASHFIMAVKRHEVCLEIWQYDILVEPQGWRVNFTFLSLILIEDFIKIGVLIKMTTRHDRFWLLSSQILITAHSFYAAWHDSWDLSSKSASNPAWKIAVKSIVSNQFYMIHTIIFRGWISGSKCHVFFIIYQRWNIDKSKIGCDWSNHLEHDAMLCLRFLLHDSSSNCWLISIWRN